jgi:fatty acid desaturase
MTDSSSDRGPQRELQLRAARAVIARELGAEQLAGLHAPNLALDLAAICGSIALFLLCAYELGTGRVGTALWWICLYVQGNLVLVMAFINHDALVHRKLLSPRLRWIVSSILVWPSRLRSAVYERQHLTHHRALGTPGDTETYKHSIHTSLRRVLYATPALMVFRTAVFGDQAVPVNIVARPISPSRQANDESRARYETATRRVILAVVAAAALWDWRLVVLGYVLPFAVVTPLLNTVRIVLEHFDLEPANPFWVGTNYRTGILTQLAFWWDSGDCHLVHHFYPSIPFYRMRKALALVRPILAREGVQEHRSVTPLLRQWFSASRGYWSLPPAAAGSNAVPVPTHTR